MENDPDIWTCSYLNIHTYIYIYYVGERGSEEVFNLDVNVLGNNLILFLV